MQKQYTNSLLGVVTGLLLGGAALRVGLPAWWGLLGGVLGTSAASTVLSRRAHAADATGRLEDLLEQERKRHAATLAYIQRILDVIPMPVYVKDADSRYLMVNRAQAKQWNRRAEDLIGVRSFDLAPNPTIAASSRAEDERVLGGEVILKEEHKPVSHITGQEQFMVITKGSCRDAEGKQVIVCAFFDATQWRIAERELKQALERETLLRERTQAFVQRLIDVIPDPFYIKDAHSRFVMVNDALAAERGMPKESLIGVVSFSLAPDSVIADETAREDKEIIAGAEVDKEQRYVIPATGMERFRQVIKRRCIHIDGSPVIVAAHFNITRWKVAERELARIAHEDALTGLPNRRCFLENTARAISRADRHDEAVSLLLFDLDHFKRINDNFGHPAGDRVLIEVANRLRDCLRTEDMPGRWGGEEFIVLLPMTDADQAMAVANRLRETIAARTVALTGHRLEVTLSCGVAQRRKHETLEQLVARADDALYRAKSDGRNTCMLA